MEIKKFNENVKYKEYFKVKDLIKILQDVDPELPVGKSGHFGEFNPMDQFDFTVGHARFNPKGISSGYTGWRKLTQFPYQEIFEITSPDIGPDPD